MATTVDAVHAHLKRDPALADLLARDLISLRRTARWLIQEYGWDTTEEAVVSALRRYAEANPVASLSRPRLRLPDSRVDARGGLALITVPRVYEVQRTLLKAWQAGGARDLLGVLPARASLQLLTEVSSVEAFRRELGHRMVEDVQSPVTAVTLACEDGPGEVTVACLGLAALAHAGIKVLEVLTSLSECTYIVPDGQRKEAFDALSELTSSSVCP